MSEAFTITFAKMSDSFLHSLLCSDYYSTAVVGSPSLPALPVSWKYACIVYGGGDVHNTSYTMNINAHSQGHCCKHNSNYAFGRAQLFKDHIFHFLGLR